MLRRLLLAVTAVAALSFASTASAEILDFGTRKGPVSHTGPFEIEVPLKDSGSISPRVQFINGHGYNRPVKVTYNAECSVDAERGSWLSIRIVFERADGGGQVTPEPASGSDFALCSALTDKGKGFWTAVSRQSIARIATGEYRVRVYGRLVNKTGAGTWRLDDSSIVVEQ